METDIQITVARGVTRVTYRGIVQFDRTTEMLRNIAPIASSNGRPLVLFDIREAEDPNYHTSAISPAEVVCDARANDRRDGFRGALAAGRNNSI